MRTAGVGLVGRCTGHPSSFHAFFFDRIVFVDLRREFNIELKNGKRQQKDAEMSYRLSSTMFHSVDIFVYRFALLLNGRPFSPNDFLHRISLTFSYDEK